MVNTLRKQILEFLAKCPMPHPSFAEAVKCIGAEDKMGEIQTELEQLEKEKIVTSFLGIDGERRLDLRTTHHFHFVCESCGDVKDIFFEDGAFNMLRSYGQNLTKPYGRVDKINMSFFGFCYNCVKKHNGDKEGEIAENS